MPTLPRARSHGRSVVPAQRQHQPADVAQQPVRPHQLRVRAAERRAGGGAAQRVVPVAGVKSHQDRVRGGQSV